MLHQPALLVLDEPTTGVDPVSRAGLWSLIARAAAEGAAVVFATSYLDEAERAAYVLVLADGRELAAGSPEQIVAAMPGRLEAAATRPAGPAGARSWRRDGRWRVWRPAGARDARGPAAEPVQPDLQDAVTVAILAREPPPVAPTAGGDRRRRRPPAPPAPGRTADGRERAARGVPGGEPPVRPGSRRCDGVGPPARPRRGGRPAGRQRGRQDHADPDAARAAARDRRAGPAVRRAAVAAGPAARRVRAAEAWACTTTSRPRRTWPSRRPCSAAAPGPTLPGWLRGYGRVLVGDLPLGVQRRVAFAEALAHRPDLLILDEPTSGVDPLARARLWETITDARPGGRRGAGHHALHGRGGGVRPAGDHGRGPGGGRGDGRRDHRGRAGECGARPAAGPRRSPRWRRPGCRSRWRAGRCACPAPARPRVRQALGPVAARVSEAPATLEERFFQLTAAAVRPPGPDRAAG